MSSSKMIARGFFADNGKRKIHLDGRFSSREKKHLKLPEWLHLSCYINVMKVRDHSTRFGARFWGVKYDQRNSVT